MFSERNQVMTDHVQGGRHPSPPLPLLAAVHVALFATGLVSSRAVAGGAFFPSPFEPALAGEYFARHADAATIAGFFLFGSAIPLGLFGVTASSRLRFLGVDVAGVWIALFGGIGAALMLLFSGMAMWALGQAGLASVPEAARVLHLLAFATGGPGFAVLFGLLVLGVSLAGGLTRRLPRWLMWLGIAIGVVAELSVLCLLAPPAALLLPLARFPGLIWLTCVSLLLPSRRPAQAAALIPSTGGALS
jgi:hypothetical protein